MAEVNISKDDSTKQVIRRFIWACLAGLTIMLVCGLAYRSLYLKLDKYLSQPVKLPVPLSAFPFQLGNWNGQDVPISETIQEVAGNDDFISRVYRNSDKQQGVSLYVAYSARPRYMQGHRPTACYPAAGWNHEATDEQTMVTKQGQTITCMVHRFHRIVPYDQTVYVLNFYLVNGTITLNEKMFSDMASRNPNIQGDPARYVAQVQITSQLEDAVLLAGREMIDEILRYFPDANGKVAAADAEKTPS
jgi:EpsI family protein